MNIVYLYCSLPRPRWIKTPKMLKFGSNKNRMVMKFYIHVDMINRVLLCEFQRIWLRNGAVVTFLEIKLKCEYLVWNKL